MRLKVGELAKRSGLTVRTLHHYHAIGLLTPSARADNAPLRQTWIDDTLLGFMREAMAQLAPAR